MNKIFSFLTLVFLSCQLFSQINSLSDLSRCLIKIQVNNTGEFTIDSTGIIEEDYSLGTGFYISGDGLFLTAAHVIKDRKKEKSGSISCYEIAPNSNFVPIVIFEDIETDIALLQNIDYTRYGKSNQYFINIDDINKELNKTNLGVYSFGFPNGLQAYNRIASFSIGKVLSTNKNLQGYKKLLDRRNVSLANTTVLSGCSGGIITDTLFNPIGLILGSILENNTRTTYYKSMYDVKKILEKYEIY